MKDYDAGPMLDLLIVILSISNYSEGSRRVFYAGYLIKVH
nr:hypothetical protein CJLB15_00115 [Campylobacter phage CJLB-15]